MDLFDTTQLGLAAALRATGARQTATAQNLANANTPGYRRVEVNFEDQLQAAFASGSDAGRQLDAFTPRMTVDPAAPQRADGSSVDVESTRTRQRGLLEEALRRAVRS